MPRGRILFADNNPDFRAIRVRSLHDHYHVLEAGSVQEAEQLLQEQWVHLAILDIRLEDDNDARDISGILLAQEPAYRSLPKIMLTSFPTVDAARAALGPAIGSLPPAVDFLRKDEGPEALLQAIAEAFARHVRINNALLIQTNPQKPVTFPHIASLIEIDLTGERLLQWAEELEDLLRRLFYERQQITLERLLWQLPGRAALVIVAFQERDTARILRRCMWHAGLNGRDSPMLPYLCSQGPRDDRHSVECTDSHHALRGSRLRPGKCRPRTCADPR